MTAIACQSRVHSGALWVVRQDIQPQGIILSKRQSGEPVLLHKCARYHDRRGADRVAQQELLFVYTWLGKPLPNGVFLRIHHLKIGTAKRMSRARHEGQLSGKLGWMPKIIGVQKGNICAFCMIYARVARGKRALAQRVPEYADATLGAGRLFQNLRTSICGAIVHSNQLPVLKGLRQDCFKRGL